MHNKITEKVKWAKQKPAKDANDLCFTNMAFPGKIPFNPLQPGTFILVQTLLVSMVK